MKDAMLEPNLSPSSMFITVGSDRLVLSKLRAPDPGSANEVVVKKL